MRELIIGDMHLGVKSNSVEWLTKQCKLIDGQICDVIESEDVDRVVFLGDLSDVRYSINQQVAGEMKKSIRALAEKLKAMSDADGKNRYVVFVAGNHDYYSPVEDAAVYNVYETLFGKEFTDVYPNVLFVSDEPLLVGDSLFLPWYWTENPDHFDELLYRYDFGSEVKAVYCHADLSVWPGGRVASLKGIPVFAGHIHFISDDPICNLHNIGAACPLTFGDVNQERYLYIAENYDIVKKIPNTTTPKFIRIFNEEIFDEKPELFENSFVQLCISGRNLELATYKDQINMLKTKYSESNIRVHKIDDDEVYDDYDNGAVTFSPNINDYIQSNIPSHLTSKFDFLKDKYNNK